MKKKAEELIRELVSEYITSKPFTEQSEEFYKLIVDILQ